jgi:hypothetical protein
MTAKNAEQSHSIASDDEVKSSLLMADESTPVQEQAISEDIDKYWLSKKSVSSEFSANMGLAARGGVMCLLIGMPFMLSPDNHILPEAWNELRRAGIVNTFAVVMFIFTLYKSVGETISFAWQGMAGTFVCSLVIWLQFQIFPGGVTPDAPPHYFWCGVVIGLAFTFLMLGLNVSILAQIFGLANYAYFHMSFMLGHSAGFSSGWQINTRGAAVSNVLVSLIGVTLAIIATLIPSPILLIRKAQTGAEVLTTETCNLWSRSVKVFLAESSEEYEKDTLLKSRDGLQGSLGALGYAIENAWWECFGLGPWQRCRMTLKAYHRRIAENHDRLPAVLFAVQHNDNGKSHFDLMNPLKAHVDELMAHSQILYQKATVAAVAGGIASGEENTSMVESVKKTKESIETLSRAFQKTKTDLGLPMVNTDQMDEHVFCYNLCSHAQIACDMGNDLIESRKTGKDLSAVEAPDLLELFRPTLPFMAFTVRNSVTLIACFLVGYIGFPYPRPSLVLPGSGGPACTAAILLTTFKPSMTKNLDRLNGVVLGTIVGQLVFCALGWCTWWGYTGICISLFVWVTGTLYMYYNSAKYGVVGCLLAAFGSAAFLQGCTDDFSDPKKSYYGIIECVVAIFITIGVDMIVETLDGGGRSSDMAYVALLDFWKIFRSSVEGILDPKRHTEKADHGALMGKVGLCQMLAPEAIDEPRWWRTPWRKLAYADGITCATKLRLALKTMEDAIPGQDDEGSKDAWSESFDKMLALPSFEKVREGVRGKMEQLERFLDVFMKETEGKMEAFRHPSELRQWTVEVEAAIEEFMTESMAKGCFSPEECTDLQDDDTCEISMFLSSVVEVMMAMRTFQHSILRSA